MTSLVGLTSCPPSLLWYVFLLLLFLFNQSSSTFLYISDIETKHMCQVGLLLVLLLTLPGFPGRSTPMALMALLVSAP